MAKIINDPNKDILGRPWKDHQPIDPANVPMNPKRDAYEYEDLYQRRESVDDMSRERFNYQVDFFVTRMLKVKLKEKLGIGEDDSINFTPSIIDMIRKTLNVELKEIWAERFILPESIELVKKEYSEELDFIRKVETRVRRGEKFSAIVRELQLTKGKI